MKKPNLRLRYNLSVSDLGPKGMVAYFSNVAARGRVNELLETVSYERTWDQARVPFWLIVKTPERGNRSPLEIAAHHPRLFKAMMDDIDREMPAPSIA